MRRRFPFRRDPGIETASGHGARWPIRSSIGRRKVDSYAVSERCANEFGRPPNRLSGQFEHESVGGGRHWTRTSDLLHVKHFRLNAVLRAWEAERNCLSHTVTLQRVMRRDSPRARGDCITFLLAGRAPPRPGPPSLSWYKRSAVASSRKELADRISGSAEAVKNHVDIGSRPGGNWRARAVAQVRPERARRWPRPLHSRGRVLPAVLHSDRSVAPERGCTFAERTIV